MDIKNPGELLAVVRSLVEEVEKLRLPAVLSLEMAAHELGQISVQTLKRMIAQGEITAVPLNKREGIPRDEIERIAKGIPAEKSRRAREGRAKSKTAALSKAAFRAAAKKI
jgi:hypothetical protein